MPELWGIRDPPGVGVVGVFVFSFNGTELIRCLLGKVCRWRRTLYMEGVLCLSRLVRV